MFACRRWILLFQLLRDDDALADHDERRREKAECEAEREAEQLRQRVRLDCVEDRERDGTAGGAEKKENGGELRARTRLARFDDPFFDALARVRRPAASEEQDGQSNQPVPELPHPLSLRPIARHVATSTAAAISHATIPSGTGPRKPIPQPPGCDGCREA